MTHCKIEIQIPLFYNLKVGEKTRKQVEEQLFIETYDELYNMIGGVNTSNIPILGAWKSKRGMRIDDKSIVFTTIVETSDRMTITNIPKIKKLLKYKKVLLKRFDQEEICMIATRCVWL